MKLLNMNPAQGYHALVHNKSAINDAKTLPIPITLPFGSVVLPPEGDGRYQPKTEPFSV
jgi:hypothetical protein